MLYNHNETKPFLNYTLCIEHSLCWLSLDQSCTNAAGAKKFVMQVIHPTPEVIRKRIPLCHWLVKMCHIHHVEV